MSIFLDLDSPEAVRRFGGPALVSCDCGASLQDCDGTHSRPVPAPERTHFPRPAAEGSDHGALTVARGYRASLTLLRDQLVRPDLTEDGRAELERFGQVLEECAALCEQRAVVS